jgi:hypothetical protein
LSGEGFDGFDEAIGKVSEVADFEPQKN